MKGIEIIQTRCNDFVKISIWISWSYENQLDFAHGVKNDYSAKMIYE